MDKKDSEYQRLEKRTQEEVKDSLDRVREKKKFKIKQLKSELETLNADIER